MPSKSELQVGDYRLRNLTNINVIVGRNGSGKSRFLRQFSQNLPTDPEFRVRYISPERAGVFRREGDLDTNMQRNKDWLRDVRQRNQVNNFKNASAYLLREVETLYLRRLQTDRKLRSAFERTFAVDRLDPVNRLLSNIFIEQNESDFQFRDFEGNLIAPEEISSGESEIIALAAEVLHFFETVDPSKFNVLLLDEPDVHIHPDMQARFARFLISELQQLSEQTQQRTVICIATHSTPLVCALASSPFTSVGTVQHGGTEVLQRDVSEQLRKSAPFFGHPLSQSISGDVPLIIEGEDDERVWQQASRTARGRMKIFPILSNTVDQQAELEQFCAEMLEALYDEPVALSLRDGDGVNGELDDFGPVSRYRLACYAIENLLMTDECLAVLGTSWEDFCAKAEAWEAENATHEDLAQIQALRQSIDRMRHEKIKEIRQLICAIAGSSKPWEVAVGQAIGRYRIPPGAPAPHSLVEYIGSGAATALGLNTPIE